jgi:hypothetical protein
MPNPTILKNLFNPLLPKLRHWQSSLPTLVLLLLLAASCTPKADSTFDLSFSIQPTNRPGIYQVTGSTNLPEGSLLSIAAIRYFRYPEATVANSATVDSYAILARQLVKVEQGTWQANLYLWQVAPDGQYQESWQQNPLKIGLPLMPSSEVTFVALLEPANQTAKLEKALENQQAKRSTNLLRYTNDGQWYLKASKNLAISLPVGKTTPPVLNAKDTNGGWGDRSSIISETNSDTTLPPPTISQTDAPLSLRQFMH